MIKSDMLSVLLNLGSVIPYPWVDKELEQRVVEDQYYYKRGMALLVTDNFDIGVWLRQSPFFGEVWLCPR